MPDSWPPISPRVLKGALVQIVPDVVGTKTTVVQFQYNPERLTRTLTPWNPFDVDQAQRGSLAPTVQPFNPKETFTLVVELDASDEMESGNPVATKSGIADRLAALKRLLLPLAGPSADLASSSAAPLGEQTGGTARPSVPVLLFVWGPGRVLPVRITTFSVEEHLFLPTLYPMQAKVNLALEVLTPDAFCCRNDRVAHIAIAAYEFTRQKEDELASSLVSNNQTQVTDLIPN